MKKYLCLALVVMFVFATAGVSYGDGALYSHGPDDEVSTEAVISTAALSLITATVGSTSRILGYTFNAVTAGTVGIYDTTSTTLAAAGTGLILEDVCTTNTSHTVWLPFPLDVDNTVYALFTAADSVLILYYE